MKFLIFLSILRMKKLYPSPRNFLSKSTILPIPSTLNIAWLPLPSFPHTSHIAFFFNSLTLYLSLYLSHNTILSWLFNISVSVSTSPSAFTSSSFTFFSSVFYCYLNSHMEEEDSRIAALWIALWQVLSQASGKTVHSRGTCRRWIDV